jgi:hypothetical protein
MDKLLIGKQIIVVEYLPKTHTNYRLITPESGFRRLCYGAYFLCLAQFGRALRLGRRGRRFEASNRDQFNGIGAQGVRDDC